MQLDPARLSIPDRYKLLIGCILPRPIALVSTASHSGEPNLAPFSFFADVGSNPMTLAFCPANTEDGLEKDTLANCKPTSEGGTGEFVVNVASMGFAASMAACAEPLPRGVSEFVLSGLTPGPCVKVRPPRVLESPISFECRTLGVIRTNPGAPSGGNLVLGEVVWVHARDGAIDDRRHVDASFLDAVGRMGGREYCSTRDRFSMPMGRAALNAPPPGA